MPSITNIGILAHVDAGKTSLTERVLFESGAIAAIGSVDAGTTRTDTMDLERQRGITIRSAVVSFTLDGHIFNLVDTPGHPDFIAEVERALRVLDVVILVVSAVEGIQPQTRRLFRVIRRLNLPCLIFLNKIDRVGSRIEPLLAEMRTELDARPVALSIATNIGTREASSTPCDLANQAVIDDLVEALGRNDSALVDRWIEREGRLEPASLMQAIREQFLAGEVQPVVIGSAISGAGVGQLLELLPELVSEEVGRSKLRSPTDRGEEERSKHQGPTPSLRSGTAPTESNGVGEVAEQEPLAAEVFKVDRMANGERAVICRIWEGSLAVRQHVEIVRPHADEEIPAGRVTGLDVYRDGAVLHAQKAQAGEIVRLHGLAEAKIGDWLGRTLQDRIPAFEPPVFEYQVIPGSPDQRFQLIQALTMLADEDPLISVRNDEVDQATYIHLYGEVQREVIESVLQDRFGLAVSFGEPAVLCVERLLGPGEAAEISGETNPPFYATVGFRIQPKQSEEPVWHYTPGKAKHNFFDAAEIGGRATLSQGPHGWPVIDVDVEVTELIYLVMSVPTDYRKLAALVMADAIKDAGTVVCEPVHRFVARVPSEASGGCIHLLLTNRAEIETSSGVDETTVIEGTIPAATIEAVAKSLPGLTQGKGDIDTRFHDYAPIAGDPPTRRRTDLNPYNRIEYLSRIKGRF